MSEGARGSTAPPGRLDTLDRRCGGRLRSIAPLEMSRTRERRSMTKSARPMVPEDLFRIRFASDPHVHPNGRRVAFVVTTLSEARDEYLSNIWIVDMEGGEPRPFTRGP